MLSFRPDDTPSLFPRSEGIPSIAGTPCMKVRNLTIKPFARSAVSEPAPPRQQFVQAVDIMGKHNVTHASFCRHGPSQPLTRRLIRTFPLVMYCARGNRDRMSLMICFVACARTAKVRNSVSLEAGMVMLRAA